MSLRGTTEDEHPGAPRRLPLARAQGRGETGAPWDRRSGVPRTPRKGEEGNSVNLSILSTGGTSAHPLFFPSPSSGRREWAMWRPRTVTVAPARSQPLLTVASLKKTFPVKLGVFKRGLVSAVDG